MVQAAWTYELPVTGSPAENLDDYEARTADGTHVGIVTGLVERDGERYLLVDAGPLPPLVHRRLAVRWRDVILVDHDALVVELMGDRARLEAAALALDPSLARHDSTADAVRVHELPPELSRSAPPGVEGPVERTASFVVLAATALSAWSVLVIVALWASRGLDGWEFAAFAVPVLLALIAIGAAGYRLYREPHVGHHSH
jgi:hypothetical protein